MLPFVYHDARKVSRKLGDIRVAKALLVLVACAVVLSCAVVQRL
jgi:hypothetical protein